MTPGPVLHPITIAPGALLALHAAHPARYPALLESAAAAEPLGCHDILFAYPRATLTLAHDGQLTGPAGNVLAQGFLPALDRWWQQERVPPVPHQLPFIGGWLLFLGYELAEQIEPRLHLPRPTAGPVAQAMRVPAAIIHRHRTGEAWIVTEPGARDLGAHIRADLERLTHRQPVPPSLLRESAVEDDPAQYLRVVERALDYIAAGEIYQANLSRGWQATLSDGVSGHHIYERLRQTNPGPFSAAAQLGEIAIISSSPERLVQVQDGRVSTRPIAGTRPRARDQAADAALARELHGHPKERAEHVMLLDLERNDLGRICEAGTVQVDEYMTIESYAHVHHIVSNVSGRLRGDVTPGGVLAAVFPGGTITGCPKVRCMEIIAELEQVPRGTYTGSLGYLNLDGSMDMNILIRSLHVRGGQLTLRAGAGIVADSIPQRELEETRAKARGVLRALGAVA